LARGEKRRRLNVLDNVLNISRKMGFFRTSISRKSRFDSRGNAR